MENPWASPWATADSESVSKPDTAAVTSPEPPPAAFFSSTPSNVNLPSGHSAWTEDDSFGAWASPEPTPSAAPSGWSIWGSGEGAGAESHLTPKPDRRRKGSNPQWPNSRSTSPGLRPPPLSKRSSADHLALDPWASELSFNRKEDPEPHIQHLPSLPTASHEDSTPFTLRSRASNISIVIETQSPLPITRHVGFDKSPSADADSEALPVRQDSPASPASSVSDEDRVHESAHHDSPVTPAEDAPSEQDADKATSKVQKLVTMYDGIARQSSFTPELLPGPKRTVSQDSSTRESMCISTPPTVIRVPAIPVDDVKLQIQNVRNAEVVEGDAVFSRGEEVRDALSVAGGDADVPELASAPGQTDDSLHLDTATGDATSKDVPNTIPHEPFEVDLGKLDDLFTVPKSHVTGDDVTVPDRVITDSFESTSERKVWYRISRYGSMRQHDAGNDENYARINWVTSSVRPQIITTVRRWMEEDSIGGRLYRGALGKGAGGPAFGWNQPSTPVSLEEFFRRGKSGRGTPEQNPRQSLSGLQPPPSSITVEQRPASMPPTHPSTANAWSGLANFDWASTSPPHSISLRQLASGPGQDAVMPPEAASFKLQAPPKKIQGPAPPPLQTLQDDPSDDEWGEMVTPSALDFPSKAAALSWESPVPPKKPHRSPTGTNGSDATASAPYSKPSLFSGSNDAPPVPADVDTSQDSKSDTLEEENPLHEARTQSIPQKRVAFSPDAAPVTAPDAAADAALARDFVSKLPNLSYMLQ